jgi:hypothetical protein
MSDNEPSLEWPDQFDRTPPEQRKPYPHGFEVSRTKASQSILNQLNKMDGLGNVKLETGAEHQTRNPHLPYADSTADDPGVVVHYERHGEQYCIPCDRWARLRDNARAIALYLKAKRALERYGVGTIEDEFSTHKLPPPDSEQRPMEMRASTPPPHEVLEISPDASSNVVKMAAKAKKKQNHPDAEGGSEEEFKKIVNAEKALLDS